VLTCVLLRDFAAAVERLHDPALRQRDLIIATDTRVPRVASSSAAPRQAGVVPGMSARQALFQAPGARVLTENHAAYLRMANTLAEGLMQFADQVEVEYQPTSTAFYLNTTTATTALRAYLTDQMPVEVTIGVAANKFTARVASAYAPPFAPVQAVAQGDEGRFLAPYPVTLLPLDSLMKRRLPMLGLRTLGDYAALPWMAAWEQFGKHGRWLHDLAKGRDLRAIRPYLPDRHLVESWVWDDPIEDWMILRVVLHRMAATMVGRLDHEAAQQVGLVLHLRNGRLVERHTQPPAEVHELPVLGRHIDTMLASMAVDAPVSALELHLEGIRERQPRQLSLFPALDETPAIDTMLPYWMERHRRIGMSYVDVMTTAPDCPPERRFVLRTLSA
jgi:nucleotidyltransferase/DNA polymerase involved in DNA repair